MNKKELARVIAKIVGSSTGIAEDVLTALSKVAAEELRKNGEFTVPDIATFKIVPRAERVGRNPATGEKINIPARKVIKAKPVKSLEKEALSDKEESTALF